MSCVSNVRSYRGADADTDHYLIIAHFRIRLSSSGIDHQKRTTRNSMLKDLKTEK